MISQFIIIQYHPTIYEAVNLGIVVYDNNGGVRHFFTHEYSRAAVMSGGEDMAFINEYVLGVEKSLDTYGIEYVEKLTKKFYQGVFGATPPKTSLDSLDATLDAMKTACFPADSSTVRASLS